MADNLTYNGTNATVPTNTKQRIDQLADGSAVPYVKLLDGTDDSEAVIKGDATNGLDVDVTRVSGVVHVDDNASTLSVDDGAGSLTVDGSVSITGSVAVTDNSGSLSVDDNGGSLTVDNAGTFAVQAAQSGTWNVGTVTSVTNVVHVDDNSATLSVDDGGGSLTVDGTVSVSGTVTVDSELTTADLDTGAGTDTRAVVGIVLGKSGGAQILSAGQTTMASSAPVAIASDQSAIPASQSGTWNIGTVTTVTTVTGVTNVVHVDDNASTLSIDDGAGSITVDGTVAATQSGTWNTRTQDGSGNALTSATRGSERALSVQIVDGSGAQVTTFGGSGGTASNFGSAFPTQGTAVGAKDSAGTNMQPLNLDASGNLKVNVAAGGGSGGTSSSFGSADPSTGTAAGFSDGTNMREARVFDLDSGAGTQYGLGVNLRKIASGGSVEAGTSSDPLRVDPTGTTAQPITDNAGSLTVDNGGTFAVQDSEKVADNAGFTDGTTKVLPAGFIFDEVAGTALTENDAAAARIDSKRAQVLVLEDATTRGQRATVTASNALKVDGSAVTQPVSGTLTAVTSITNVVHVDDNGGSLTVDVADVTGSGNLTASAQAVTLSSLNGANTAAVQITGSWTATVQFEATVDASNWFAVNAVVPTTGVLVTSATANGQWQIDVGGYVGFRVRCSAFTSGTIVVTVRSSITGVGSVALDAPLPAGTNVIGALSANQSVNVAQINGVAATMGNGASGTGVQRVTIANDSTGVLATVTNVATIGTSVTPGTAAANLGKAEDAAHASGDTGVMMLAVRQDTLANSTSTDGDYGAIKLTTAGRVYTSATVDAALPAGTNTIGNVVLATATSGGTSVSRKIAAGSSADKTQAKGSAGQIYGWAFMNTSAALRYVKVYDNTSAGTTVGSTTPLLTIGLPIGGGSNITLPQAIACATGITYAYVTGAADSDSTNVTANDIVGQLFYA